MPLPTPHPHPPPLGYLAGVDRLVALPGAKHVGSDALGVGTAVFGVREDVDVGADQVTGEGHCGGRGARGGQRRWGTPQGLLGCSGTYS